MLRRAFLAVMAALVGPKPEVAPAPAVPRVLLVHTDFRLPLDVEQYEEHFGREDPLLEGLADGHVRCLSFYTVVEPLGWRTES